ncbi:arginine--tRNA ligase, chloroplastic/mitochondrial [Tanacetum coccineum]
MAASSGLCKGCVLNIGYDIDHNVIPDDKRLSADIGNLIQEDESFSKQKIWSADDNVIPEDKRWSADINEILEDKRWSFREEISKLFDHSLKASFPDLTEQVPLILASQEGEPGDYNCQNVLTIWPKLRKIPELRETYPHIQKPRDIGEAIKKNLPPYASHMLDEDTSIEDVGFVAFALSRKWMAESIHKMLNDGIETWAPKLPVERVLIAFPSLDEEIHVGLSRRLAIALTHFRMLKFSKVAAAFSLARDSAQARYFQNLPNWGEGILRRLFSIKNREGDVVIDGEGILAFILAARDFHNSSKDLAALRVEIEVLKADWIVYVTPVRQQEYIEMCFTAAKLEKWITTDRKGKWSPSLKKEYPVASYLGYRTCSTEQEELANLLGQVRDRCHLVAQGKDARLLGYTADAVFACVLMYTLLKNDRLADCTFTFDEMVNEEGNTFVYLLHRRAEIHRITSDSRKDIDELKKASDLTLEKYEDWEEGEERMLDFHLLEFTEVLEESCVSVLPHRMCKYLYDLTKKFNRYNDVVRGCGSVAETSRLLLSEATAVVMEKCFHLLGITPEVPIAFKAQPLLYLGPSEARRIEKQKMTEIEQKDKTPIIELKFVDRFITPSFVSGARDPPRKSRFELLSIRPLVTSDPKFGKGNMFGLISVSDKYGSRSDGGSHLFEPDFPYVHLFNFEWCDPIKMRNGGTVHLGNPSSHHSVPFSTSIEIRFELYVTSEKKDACFQLSNRKFKKKLSDIWDDKSKNSKCGSYNVKGEDGRTRMHYILIKDAIDTSMEVRFKAGTHHRVHGHIFAYYGGDSFSYDCPYGIITDYKGKLFSSYLKDGPISLERSFLAVPSDASLIIEGYLVDHDTNEVILHDCREFIPPTKGCSTVGTLYGLDGTACSLELKVNWKY